MSTTISKLAAEIKNEFLDQNRDLLACISNSAEDVFTRISAALTLDRDLNEEFAFFGEGVDQPGHAGKEAKEDVRKLLRRSLAIAFNRGMVNGVIKQAVLLTEEADQQLLGLKYLAGTEQRPAPKPAPVILTYDQQLQWDWNNLPVDKINQKRRESAQYRKRLAEILDGNTVGSGITTMHDGSKL